MFYKIITSSVLFLFCLTSCNNLFFKNNLSQILGVDKVEIIESDIITDEFGGFGEGYSLEVYDLSESTIKTFLNTASKNLPNKKEGKNWQKKDWSKTPIDSSYSEIFIMTLNYYNRDKKLESKLNEIKGVLGKGKVYYSFYYSPDKDNPQDAQLFILDIENKRLYAIDSST